MGGGGGGGYSDIFIHTLAPVIFYFFYFFGGGGVKILNFNIFWGFQKMNIFWVLRFCEYFLFLGRGSSQYWTIFRGHFYAFRVFFKVNVQNGEYFFISKI